jgi:head-tail adaptor
MNPGRLDKRVTFMRRPAQAGNTRGNAYEPVLTVWAAFRQATGREVVEGGRLTDEVPGFLTIRISAAARLVTAADRVQIPAGGQEYAITSVGGPERRAGTIEIAVARKRA